MTPSQDITETMFFKLILHLAQNDLNEITLNHHSGLTATLVINYPETYNFESFEQQQAKAYH